MIKSRTLTRKKYQRGPCNLGIEAGKKLIEGHRKHQNRYHNNSQEHYTIGGHNAKLK